MTPGHASHQQGILRRSSNPGPDIMAGIRAVTAAVALVIAAITVAGCGQGTGESGSGRRSEGFRPGSQAVPWGLVSASGDTVVIQYPYGQCLQHPKVALQESSTRVVISVSAQGRSPGEVCSQAIIPRIARVDLRAPLGDRQLLDSSTQRPPTIVPSPTSTPR